MSVLKPEMRYDLEQCYESGLIKRADVDAAFKPDLSVQQLKDQGIYDEMYGLHPEDRPASMTDWPAHWLNPADPKGWLQWYENYSGGRRIDDDVRQISRWKSFKARHGAQFSKNPTPRRAIAMQHWAIDPFSYLSEESKPEFQAIVDAYRIRKQLAAQKRRAKEAALLPDVSLQPQQQRIVDDAGQEEHVRKLLYHGLGSGKTLASIAAAETLGDPYVAVVPASLRPNFKKEQERFTDKQTPSSVISYNALAKGAPISDGTAIFDEAHRLRNEGSKQTMQAKQLAEHSKNVIMLSGSPIVNDPADLAPIIEMLTNHPMPAEQFKERYIGTKTRYPGLFNWLRGIKPVEEPAIAHEDELRKILEGHVDYNPPPNTGVEQTDKTYKSIMSQPQAHLFDAFWDKLPWILKWKLKYDYPLSNREIINLQSFLSGPRQVGLSTLPFMRGNADANRAFGESPKLQQAMGLLEQQFKTDPKSKAVIFSNFIDAGLTPYSAALTQRNIPHGVFHGGLTDAARKQIVDDYNADKLKAILLGPSGGEGLSLRGTSLLQLLDPHWNETRLNQAIGRGIRFDSHAHLPENERKINVQRFEAELPPTIKSKIWRWLTLSNMRPEDNRAATDAYIRQLAAKKQKQNQLFLDLLKDVGTVNKQAAEQLPPFNVPHTFITGHAGAGKSTLAKTLATLLGRPLVSLDDDPRWQNFLKGDPELGPTVDPAVLAEGQRLRRQIVEDALKRVTAPTLFEGAHLLSTPDLLSGPVVVVDGSQQDILEQKLNRSKQKALAGGKELTPEELQRKQQLGQQTYSMYEPYVQKIKQHPNAIVVSGKSREPAQVMQKLGEYAKGIPDKRYFRPINQLQEGQLADYLVQQHNAYRAGPHKDIRFGDEKGLYSWATRKPLPTPGQRTALFEQPTHSHKYLGWEGEIPRGQYGGGTVKVEDQGKILVTGVKPDAIHFTLAHKRFPERFVMVKPKGWKQPKSWLLINKTPIAGLPYEKVRYQKIPAQDVENYIDKMQKGDTFEAKIDGASSLIKLLKDGVEVTSYRQSKETGRPILYTEKLFDGLPKLDIPPELVGTVLKGELYGSRVSQGVRNRLSDARSQIAAPDSRGYGDLEALSANNGGAGAATTERVIPPQELGGILNSTLARAIEDKRSRGIKLKNMVYDIQQIGKKPVDWHKTNRPDRRKLIEQVLGYLPQDTFHISPAAETPDDARKLWMDIQQGTHPLTHEGVVMWPHGGPPMKSKLTEDTDVHITGTYPGEGKYTGSGIGGFTYALEPGGPTVGRVGTGLSDQLRQEAFSSPDVWSGRVARIRSQEQLPSGAYRAPAFLAFHEDYPTKTSSVLVQEERSVCTVSDLADLGICYDKEGSSDIEDLLEDLMLYEKRSEDDSNILGYTGAVMGGAMPAAATGQYLTQDLPRFHRAISDAPELGVRRPDGSMSFNKVLKTVQPGDVGVAGYYNSADSAMDTFLGYGSGVASGGPGEHGIIVGPRMRPLLGSRMANGGGTKLPTLFHGGQHLEFPNFPQTETALAGAYEGATRAGAKFWERLRKGKMLEAITKTPQEYAAGSAGFARWADRQARLAMGARNTGKPVAKAEWLHDYLKLFKDQERPYVFMRPKTPLSPTEQRFFNKSLVNNATPGYDFMGAMRTGVSRFFMPRMPFLGSTQPGLAHYRGKGIPESKSIADAVRACSMDKAHCGSLPENLLASVGLSSRRGDPRWALPNDMLLNNKLNVVGVVNKPDMLRHLRNSAIARTGLGLGATAATAGAGYGVGSFLNRFAPKGNYMPDSLSKLLGR